MVQEVGPSINLRGRGSHKLSKKPEPSNNEEIYVLVEEDNKNSLENACMIVEKMLVHVEERNNIHKLAQLRELQKLKVHFEFLSSVDYVDGRSWENGLSSNANGMW